MNKQTVMVMWYEDHDKWGEILQNGMKVIRKERIDSHYCRKGNDREFIDVGLDISQMYRLHAEECQTEHSKSVALKYNYESVLIQSSIFFSARRKLCAHYALHTKTVHKKRKYNCSRSMMITKRKKLSREVKENDIVVSREQPSNNTVACFDMQAVIPLPRGNVSTFY
ncbi:hypothetical protein PR048_028467 [Dryococelus australis]|uniref:Uncharacterized protein n=1 Tax=Dryococelus australis TaxID=614101 RepID=A0ABQ9GEI3_9NEOP|nr:hypothetical protein PR048_028467 [Dryococelus australis]